MSAGPLTEYSGVTGVADSGGSSLIEDLNVYYGVRTRRAS
jgi:Amt family ammonium transporter